MVKVEVFRLEIRRYELQKNENGLTLVVYVDEQLTEFASELGRFPKQKKDLNVQVRELIKQRFPNVPIKAAKVIAGSMLVTTLYLGATAPIAGAQTTSGETQPAYKYDTYTVKAGDTLLAISKRYNITVESLKLVNGLKSDMIFVGQQLKLPFFTYTVSAGDTLYNIAKRYNITVDQIRTTNQLTTDVLNIGQTLRIPQVQPDAQQPVTETIQQPVEETATQPAPTTNYTVAAGDTLYNISIKFNTTVDQIKTLNNLTTNTLNIGQVLKIPGTASTTAPETTAPVPVEKTTYTVVPGDTLYAIARNFNTTVTAIQSANNLTTTNLVVGQTLIIPATQQTSTQPTPPADTVAPVIPTLAPIQTVTTANQTGLPVKGTTEPNALVTLTLSDTTNTPLSIQVKANESGAFQATIDASKLNDGTLTLKATATDQAGNKSNESTATLKKDTKTDAPTIINTKVINKESTLAYPIKGTAEPGSRVQFTFSDGVSTPVTTEAIANERGEFSTFVNLQALRDGTISVTTKATDPFGNESGITKLSLTKDTTIATPALVEQQVITSQTAAAYPVTGSAEPGATITIRATDGVNPAIEKTIPTDNTGAFRTNIDITGLNDGSITITAISTDIAKNSSDPFTATIIKDTFAAEPVFNPIQEVTNKNASNYTMVGIADPNSTVQLVLSDGVNPEVTVGAVANEAGEFRSTIDLRTLNDGEIKITANAIDQYGNRSTTEETTIIKETTLAPPVISNSEIINSQSAAQYSIFGNAQPGTTVDITISDGVNPDIITSTTTNENGEYHVNVDVSPLIDTTLTISAFQTSAAGISSQEATISVEKDTESPTAPIFHNDDFINQSNQTAYNLIGKAENNTEVQVRIFNPDGQELKATGTADENGEYSIPVDLSSFADGDISFEFTQIDQAGNVSPSVTKTLIKDTVGPTTVNLETKIPIYNGNVFTYPLKGTTEPHTRLEIVVSDGVRTVTKTMETDEKGSFEEILDFSTLNDGELTVSFRATDNAGNVGEPAGLTIEKDTKAPAGVVTTAPQFVNTLNQSNYVITGSSVEEGATVEMVITDGTKTITQTTQVVNGAFTGAFDLSGLADGTLSFEARQIDRAGNRSIAQASTIEKDTVVENAVATKNGFRYENLQYIYTVIGTAEANAQIEVTLNDPAENVLVTRIAKANEFGFYSVDVFVDRVSNVDSASVRQTDRAGNTSELTSVSLSTYTVTAGDSLYAIAKRYNTTVDSLMTLNNLSSDVIQANQTLRLPITASEVVNLGYMYFGNTKEYVNTVSGTGHAVNIVSPSYFDINADGTLKLTYQVDRNFIESMHRQGIRVVPFLSNHWNREVGRAMLQNKELAAQQIADAIARYNLDGVNVDIENVTDADRENYTEFVRLLRTLIPSTKEVSVAVAANPNGWDAGWHGSYDYTELAKYADYLMIMAYDESYQGGDPGSVASHSWVEKSVQYALAQNVAPDKVVLGIAHFGRYWIEGQSYGGFGISNSQVETLIHRYNGTVVFDEISKTPKASITIKAGDPVTYVGGQALAPGTYTIWFENEESIRHKLELVSKYNIRGVGNWSLGQENKNVWSSYTTTLPNTVPVVSPVYTAPEYKTYTVVAGDSLWAIANRNNTTVDSVKKVNGLTSESLYVGQVLRLPVDNLVSGDVKVTTTETGGQTGNATPTTETTPTTGATAPTYTTSYTVVAGDSLSAIAQRNNTTVTAIKTANNLTTDTIYVGQVLKIPTNVVTYTVVAGDSLWGIASRYNTTVTSIKTANNLTSDALSIGQTLKIPVS
ncbi:LysM peptidoglycan-binding domain-containing protein [Fredinandcohnia sp. 179-A 10B2 NHS]|uniref:LysM peptidoglycan-binding domain-containing protein n=1 Tax=Fredinandcohnia sp. 179-A 10B2 NHS TaxID=3235176 RepID=UPI0039A13C39